MEDFERVYRHNAVKVYRYLLSLGCPDYDAEDVVQETFVKALIHIDSFRGECELSVWLCRIARNIWMNHLKKKRREDGQLTELLAAPRDDCGEWLDLIGRLEEPYRSVFRRRALGGYDYGELAAEYGKSESWARVTYHRARMKLRQMLAGEEERK
ncbi:MAG: RNA polymerase sigma factor [Oscillospiraceae bacterium]|nr:RNA polymerase sigma factor [Oscillospiraceae bacterium]